MGNKLTEYRRKRDPGRTPEPVPESVQDALPRGDDNTFVIQEHHARALHWDFRLERDGVLVSWAVPKGLPVEPKTNHLAVHTEDHPLEYSTFAGDIPRGEYGGGHVKLWDSGHYITEKWTEREVKVVLSGRRVSGRYVLFKTGGKNWMIHRMDGAVREGWESLPDLIRPMLTSAGDLPQETDDPNWAYEMHWEGQRALVYVDGGRIRVRDRGGADVSGSYPELRGIGEQLGITQVVLDGTIVALGPDGLPSADSLRQRADATSRTKVQRLTASHPVTYLAFDLLHLDGESTIALPYQERRELLERLDLTGPSWQTPPDFRGGADVLRASREQGLAAIVAKRRSAAYRPGRRSPDWRKVSNQAVQEVVVAGWRPGSGNRSDTIGSLLLGVPEVDGGLRYAGRVSKGLTAEARAELEPSLRRLQRKTTPLSSPPPSPVSSGVRWLTPRLVAAVAHDGWSDDGRLLSPSWRGLRPGRAPADLTTDR